MLPDRITPVPASTLVNAPGKQSQRRTAAVNPVLTVAFRIIRTERRHFLTNQQMVYLEMRKLHLGFPLILLTKYPKSVTYRTIARKKDDCVIYNALGFSLES
jgi:hypothetical protein